MTNVDDPSLRRAMYGMLLFVTIGITTARIIGVELVYEPSIANRPWPSERPEKMPTFGSNDRSRWATVRALVENGTFVIGERIKDPKVEKGYRDEGIVFQDGYKSIDIVKNPETNKFYSSKPPLYSCVVACEYWLLVETFGWSLTEPHYRWPVVCTILITFNILPLIVFFCLLARLLEEYGTTNWGRIFVFTAACFGTFLTTFAVTLNNHTPAACCVMFAIYPLFRGRMADLGRSLTARELLLSGFFSGLAATLDLPVAVMIAFLAGLILLKSPRGFVLFLGAALIPIAGLLAANYVSLGEFNVAYSKFGGPWYEYEGSHWIKAKINPNQAGIDFAHEDKLTYAFHVLIGHHGLFSLTPLWLFALAGMLIEIGKRHSIWRIFGVVSLLISIVLIGFYIRGTNNYGGWTSGARWQFWLTPLYLLAMLPVIDRLGMSRTGRVVSYVFLAVSAFSAAYPVWNPWRHPWIYVLCEYMDWVKY